MKIGERIKKLRKEKHIPVDSIAAAANVSIATIYRYENGEIADVPAGKADAIADALGTTTAYLTGKLEADLRALDIEIKYRGYAGVELLDLASDGGSVRYSLDQWRRIQENNDFKSVWRDLQCGKEEPIPASEAGLSEEKRKLISAIKAMPDADVRKLRIIVDQVILARV